MKQITDPNELQEGEWYWAQAKSGAWWVCQNAHGDLAFLGDYVPADHFREIHGPIPHPGQQLEIRYDDDGKIDEVVASGAQVQVERMDYGLFTIIIDGLVLDIATDATTDLYLNLVENVEDE